MVIIIVGLVACNNSLDSGNQAQTPCTTSLETGCESTKTSAIELTSPKCYGLFVDVSKAPYTYARSGSSGRLTTEYRFVAGEPITVTAIVLVFGEGELIVVDRMSPLRNYKMKITDSHNRQMPLTKEGERVVSTGISARGGIIIDQTGPLIEPFRIDEWFDLGPEQYTLIISREVWVSNTLTIVQGNPVLLDVRP
jgi:hypothetical protein